MGKLIYPVALAFVALPIALNGYSRDGVWYGAGAMFFFWWFHNAWEARNRDLNEERLIAAYAPELVGKDFVASSAYVLGLLIGSTLLQRLHTGKNSFLSLRRTENSGESQGRTCQSGRH